MTYEELVAEAEKFGYKMVRKDAPKEHTFTAIARFDRGLGAEYVTLKPVTAFQIAEAQKLAEYQASLHFQTEEGFKDAIINEIRIRPND